MRQIRHIGDRGSVTVEAALSLSGVLMIAIMMICAVLSVIAQLRCVDAAREAARLVARGDDHRVVEVIATLAPRGATFVVKPQGEQFSIEVKAESWFIPLRATSYARYELGIADATI